jgi:8-oxo-dGTP diphosphatase
VPGGGAFPAAGPGRLVGALEIPNPERDVVYEVADYRATVVGGELRPGDDAADAAWYDPAELTDLPLTDNLLDFLTRYGVLDHPPRRS